MTGESFFPPNAGPNMNNIIGGSEINANVIAYNENLGGDEAPAFIKSGAGVHVAGNSVPNGTGPASTFNTITFNSIFCNGVFGIDLITVANESVTAPLIYERTTTLYSGIGVTGNTVHIYRNPSRGSGTGCDCEGEIFVATVPVINGFWTYTFSPALTTVESMNLTATQTTPTIPGVPFNQQGSTSEFSSCDLALPVTYIYFNALKIESAAQVNWGTQSETNNKEFQIQRSIDGINFITIGSVAGANNSNSLMTYTYIDENPPLEVVYYRINQVDFDGKSSLSGIRQLNFGENQLIILTKPNSEISILSSFKSASEVSVVIFSASGQVCLEKSYSTTNGMYEKEIGLSHLAPGIYLVRVYSGDQQKVVKIEIK